MAGKNKDPFVAMGYASGEKPVVFRETMGSEKGRVVRVHGGEPTQRAYGAQRKQTEQTEQTEQKQIGPREQIIQLRGSGEQARGGGRATVYDTTRPKRAGGSGVVPFEAERRERPRTGN